jgi:acyl-CoA dehydrogenase
MARAALDFTRDQLREVGVEIEYGGRAHSQSAVVATFLELEALVEAAELTVLRAAWLSGEGKSNNLEASVCKAKTGTVVRQATQGCIDLLGAMGVSREHLLEKWFRDVRITDIYEGTGEIQRMITARELLGYTRADLSSPRPDDDLRSPSRKPGRASVGAWDESSPSPPGSSPWSASAPSR